MVTMDQIGCDPGNFCQMCRGSFSLRHNETINGLQVCRYCANRSRGTYKERLEEQERFALHGKRS